MSTVSTKRIPQEVLAQFRYEAGHLYWREVKGNRTSGSVGAMSSGYLRVRALRKAYAVHRIIYVMHHGEPAGDVDHINRDRTDNRIENLRDVSRSVNAANTNRGVTFNKRCNKWQARWAYKHLGLFDNALDAWAKRKSEENNRAYC